MDFFMKMIPPTVTAQEKKVAVVGGRPVFYEPTQVRQAKALLMSELAWNKPMDPITGPVELTAIWYFPKGKSHRDGEWRVTRPDTDNLQKMLKDCMTKTGYWNDDAQVVREVVEKRWSAEPTGIRIMIKELEVEDGKHYEK